MVFFSITYEEKSFGIKVCWILFASNWGYDKFLSFEIDALELSSLWYVGTSELQTKRITAVE